MRTNKKAQIRLAENIMVIIIFVFILVFGIAFFTVYQKQTSGTKHKEREEKAASSVLAKIMALPELKCLSSTGQEEVNCFDLYKVKVLNAENHTQPEFIDHFYDIMLESKVSLETLKSEIDEIFTIYENEPVVKHDTLTKKMPVFLYDPINEQKYYAILKLDYYYVR
ncbi:hypothetical protein DRJ17_00015 [Candidatus Woesearchaeota archaeon]|nr:MAG: hypothetical protein DRJ17_00015 [Candidatus Woesearchaeota archaeon]